MKRRDFIEKTGCGAAGIFATGIGLASAQEQTPPPPPSRKRYAIEIEIYEVGAKTSCCKKGDRYTYPEDIGKICGFLHDSMNSFIKTLQWGGIFPWRYSSTPYEKKLDENGITTEFIRCPDPTESGVVAKITRKEISG
ncbi:hypothetical protein ACFLRX_03665 [Acidobacteriota bacterium]